MEYARADPDQTDGDGADLDLHLAHPTATAWFDRDLDCHYRNPTPSWGNGLTQSATLDVDDTDGAGPEKISLQEPEDTTDLGAPYRVAVHYYSAEAGLFGDGTDYGTSTATVRITFRGQAVEEFSRELNHWDLWEAALINWSPNDRSAEALSTPLMEYPPPGL